MWKDGCVVYDHENAPRHNKSINFTQECGIQLNIRKFFVTQIVRNSTTFPVKTHQTTLNSRQIDNVGLELSGEVTYYDWMKSVVHKNISQGEEVSCQKHFVLQVKVEVLKDDISQHKTVC